MANLNTVDPSIDLVSANDHKKIDATRKLYLFIFALGLIALFLSLSPLSQKIPIIMFVTSFGLMSLGSLFYITKTYLTQLPGIKNNDATKSSLSSRGALGWVIAIVLTGFYIIIYWFPGLFINWYVMMDPLAKFIRGAPISNIESPKDSAWWFFYGTMYTFAVVVMGVRALIKYRHSRYQIIRTSSVMFCQFILAWLIPALLVCFQQPEKYLNYFWPLTIKDGYPSNVNGLLNNPAALSKFLLIWSLTLTFLATPVLTYFYGKRWYCSWVCGCGGLANTFGDPWRQLSNKKLYAWKIERVSVHLILLFAMASTCYIWFIAIRGGDYSVGEWSTKFTKSYGFLIGMIFAGVIGTGFYPILGTRVWCRFGCPQAAILGILQRFFSRFRITTNGGQCISCGNCSKYCEMGIDVRSYAQRGANIIRASCVGCGMCSAVCPRGVLNLENGPTEGRENKPLALSDIIQYDESWKKNT